MFQVVCSCAHGTYKRQDSLNPEVLVLILHTFRPSFHALLLFGFEAVGSLIQYLLNCFVNLEKVTSYSLGNCLHHLYFLNEHMFGCPYCTVNVPSQFDDLAIHQNLLSQVIDLLVHS